MLGNTYSYLQGYHWVTKSLPFSVDDLPNKTNGNHVGYQSYQSYQIFDYFLKKNIIIQYYIINITNIVLCDFLKCTLYCALDGNAL